MRDLVLGERDLNAQEGTVSRPRKRHPTELGLQSLEPRPMSPAEVADLVERARGSGTGPVTKIGLRAAQLARAERISLSDAAWRLGCSVSAASKVWRWLYPDVPSRVNRRPR